MVKYLEKYARVNLETRAENLINSALIFVLLLSEFTQN